jgi:hypothetical protein
MMKFLPPVIAVLFCLPFAYAEMPKEWELTSQSPDFTLYKKPSRVSPDLVAFRGVGILNYSPLDVAVGILDRARRPQWMSDVQGLRTVRVISPGHFVEYSGVKTPFIIKNRDFVIRSDIEIDATKSTIMIVSKSVEDPDAPLTSAVRGFTDAKYVIEPGPKPGTSKLTADMDVDPKGSVPKWIVIHFQKSWPVIMFRSLQYFLGRRVATLPTDLEPIFLPLKTKPEKSN